MPQIQSPLEKTGHADRSMVARPMGQSYRVLTPRPPGTQQVSARNRLRGESIRIVPRSVMVASCWRAFSEGTSAACHHGTLVCANDFLARPSLRNRGLERIAVLLVGATLDNLCCHSDIHKIARLVRFGLAAVLILSRRTVDSACGSAQYWTVKAGIRPIHSKRRWP